VSNERSGKPRLEYSAALAALLQARGIRRSHLTLTDERGMAAATVILECDA
jgi:holo-[acyl-carrier protein] synthase